MHVGSDVFRPAIGRPAHVMNSMDAVQAKGARLVAVTCTERNPLATTCNYRIHLPLERELCPFNLSPVTSTAVQLIFGNTIAVALMQVRCMSQVVYATAPLTMNLAVGS